MLQNNVIDLLKKERTYENVATCNFQILKRILLCSIKLTLDLPIGGWIQEMFLKGKLFGRVCF
jgi:hypothetical protein